MLITVIVSTCFLICEINCLVQTDNPRSVIDNAPEKSLFYLNKINKDVKLWRSYKVIDRRKRSLWKEFIQNVAAGIETFHTNPVLAEGINNADRFGKIVKKQFRDTSKSMNGMRFATSSRNRDPKKPIGKSEEFIWNNVDYGDSKEKKGEDDMDKPVDTIREEPLKKESVTAPQRPQPSVMDPYEQQVFDYWKEVNNLVYMHENVKHREDTLIETLLDNAKNLNISEVAQVFTKGVSESKSEKIILRILKQRPKLMDRAMEDIRIIRLVREDIQRRHEVLTREMTYNLPGEEIDMIDAKLKNLRKINRKWINFKNDPLLVKKRTSS